MELDTKPVYRINKMLLGLALICSYIDERCVVAKKRQWGEVGQPIDDDDDDFGPLPFRRLNEKRDCIYLNGVIKRVLWKNKEKRKEKDYKKESFLFC